MRHFAFSIVEVKKHEQQSFTKEEQIQKSPLMMMFNELFLGAYLLFTLNIKFSVFCHVVCSSFIRWKKIWIHQLENYVFLISCTLPFVKIQYKVQTQKSSCAHGERDLMVVQRIRQETNKHTPNDSIKARAEKNWTRHIQGMENKDKLKIWTDSWHGNWIPEKNVRWKVLLCCKLNSSHGIIHNEFQFMQKNVYTNGFVRHTKIG